MVFFFILAASPKGEILDVLAAFLDYSTASFLGCRCSCQDLMVMYRTLISLRAIRIAPCSSISVLHSGNDRNPSKKKEKKRKK